MRSSSTRPTLICRPTFSLPNKEEADFIAISRPLSREPDLIRRWESGDFQAPACISRNKCLEALYQGRTLHCAVQKGQSPV